MFHTGESARFILQFIDGGGDADLEEVAETDGAAVHEGGPVGHLLVDIRAASVGRNERENAGETVHCWCLKNCDSFLKKC